MEPCEPSDGRDSHDRLVDEHHQRAVAVVELFNDEKFAECEEELRSLLSSIHLPLTDYIFCHRVLSAYLEDWYEAEYERLAAEYLFQSYYRLWPPGDDTEQQELMRFLRRNLDNLAANQKEDRPDNYRELLVRLYATWGRLAEAGNEPEGDNESESDTDSEGDTESESGTRSDESSEQAKPANDTISNTARRFPIRTPLGVIRMLSHCENEKED